MSARRSSRTALFLHEGAAHEATHEAMREAVEGRLMDVGERWMRHMRRGELDAAWRPSDAILARRVREPGWRDRARELPRHAQPVWDGTPVAGRRVLVRCYHGLGDTIQFVRYAPMLRATAASVVLWVQPELIPLLGSVRGVDHLLPLHDGAPEAGFDVDVEIMELPHLFRSSLRTIPRDVPYLHPSPGNTHHDDAPARHARAGAPAAESLQVGLIWQAGEWDDRRSVPSALLAPLAEVPGVSFHLLQHGVATPPPLPAISGSARESVLATARRMRSLDLVISVDSMPAHLAGALGVPTWTLLHADADWRWLEETERSPWYPTMRLFRQRQAGDWVPVIARVAAALTRRASPVGASATTWMAHCRGSRVSTHSNTRGTSHA